MNWNAFPRLLLSLLAIPLTLALYPAANITAQGEASSTVYLDVAWERSPESATLNGGRIGAAVEQALRLPTSPSAVWDNGAATPEINRRSVPTGYQWASWQQRHSVDLRRFKGVFILPDGVDPSTTEGVLFDPFYAADIVPVNDNVYVYVNGQRQLAAGTNYGARNGGYAGRSAVANETDGWYIPGGIVLSGLRAGVNTIDLIVEERNVWGGLGYLMLRFGPRTDCIKAPSGLNSCLLEPGDILIQRNPENILVNQFFMGLGGTYFTHTALYVGSGMTVEAAGVTFSPADQVREISLKDAGWLDAGLYDWAVVRPTATDGAISAAVLYARTAAEGEAVRYNFFAAKDAAVTEGLYCSLLVWKAYKQVGLNLEADRGGAILSPGVASLLFYVTPDDLFYSAGLLSNRSTIVQSKAQSISRTIWRWIMWIQSPAHLMLTDSQGRRAGYDPASQRVLNEIPGVVYSGTKPGALETLSVSNAEITGDWELTVSGYARGPYYILAAPIDGRSSPLVIVNRATAPAQIDRFRIPDPEQAGEITVGYKAYLPLLRR